MNAQRPLFWDQGVVLQPLHFQLMELTSRGLLTPYQKHLQPYFWGVGSLTIDKSALGVHSFDLQGGEFLFPDGTFVSLADNGSTEARRFDEAWMDAGKPFTVYLGLKRWRDAAKNVSVLPIGENDVHTSARLVTAGSEEVPDLHAGGPATPVKRLRFLVKICWETELDQLGDYDLIPLARLQKFGAEVRLSDEFIPPCLCYSASPPLRQLVGEIRHQVVTRGEQLAEHKSRRGIQSAEFGSRDMVYFLALRSVNRYLPLLFHYTEGAPIHPWHIYGVLRQLIGELSGFSERIGVLGQEAEGKRVVPDYDHRDLWGCFCAAQGVISRLLDEITAGPEYVVSLIADGTCYAADLKPGVFEGRNRFYLALKTEEDPKGVLKAVADIAKLSSREHLQTLVTRSLPGIGLQYLQIPPQELPRRANTCYFAIDHHDQQWSAVAKQYGLALYWNGAPPDLKVELMVVGR